MGLAVIEENIVFVQFSTNAKVVALSLDVGGVDHSAPCEGSVGDKDWEIAHEVVDSLMPGKDFHGIGLGDPVKVHAKNTILRLEVIDHFSWEKYRIGEGGDSVLGRPTATNFATGNERGTVILAR